MIDFSQLRRSMVNGQIRVNEVTDLRIIAAMLEIPRERFVPDHRASLAYLDEDIIVRDAAPGRPARYLLEPMVLAKLIQALDLAATDRVLDVGCATGYSSAVLSRLADRVVAVEEDADLAARARRLLADLGMDNVDVKVGPLAAGASEQAPYDAILLNGCVELIPEGLQGQLKQDGRLAGVVLSGGIGRGYLYLRTGETLSRRALFDGLAPPLPGFQEPPRFVF